MKSQVVKTRSIFRLTAIHQNKAFKTGNLLLTEAVGQGTISIVPGGETHPLLLRILNVDDYGASRGGSNLIHLAAGHAKVHVLDILANLKVLDPVQSPATESIQNVALQLCWNSYDSPLLLLGPEAKGFSVG